MSLSEVEFAFFFPAVFVLYWLLPRRVGCQNGFLLAVSYLFYASWDVRLLPLLVASTAADYALALFLGAHPPSSEPRERRKRRWALGLSLACNLGALGYFKYCGFFAESLNALLSGLGLPSSFPVLRLALPLGISFYTLQKLGYMIDVFHGRQAACRSLLTFATFVAFFPQITAGPISRGRQLLPQLAAPRRLRPELIAQGVSAFLMGFTQKAYVADLLSAHIVNPVFAHPDQFSVAAHWAALFAYAVQVFCDFSGYSLMALGLGRLLGVELPQNFSYPFFSTSMLEFWRRWHITLNQWLFDYIYNPLVTGQGWWRGRLDLGLVVVFLVSGLWHGASAVFLLWGMLHGVGLVVNRRWDEFYRGLCRKDRSYVALRKSAGYAAATWVLTQSFFVLTLIPFRAPSLTEAWSFIRGLFIASGQQGVEIVSFNVVTCGLFFLLYHLLELPLGQAVRERFFSLPATARGCVYGLVIVYLLLFVPLNGGTFIYAQF